MVWGVAISGETVYDLLSSLTYYYSLTSAYGFVKCLPYATSEERSLFERMGESWLRVSCNSFSFLDFRLIFSRLYY
jgi:hypothetical protein